MKTSTHSGRQVHGYLTDKTKVYLILVAMFAIVCVGFAQEKKGAIRVYVTDVKTKEEIPFANVLVTQKGVQVATGTSDFDGLCTIGQLAPGKYDVKTVYVGYKSLLISDVVVNSAKTTYLNVKMDNDGVELQEVAMYSTPIIDANVISGCTVTRQEYQSMADKSIGVYSNNSNVVVRGSRGNNRIYIDGERIVGNATPRGTEEYGTVKENTFNSVSSQPLSTFAIDVDAASYSNTRRMLQDGILPPKDAVRIEEFINYFTYNYPKPKEKEPFSINTEFAVCPWNKEHALLQIGIKGKEVDSVDAVPSHLVFLIDVSGSMSSEDKLPLLKRAFKLLIKQLREQDKLSIVVYAGSSGMILENVSGDEKEKMNEALDVLSAGGSTAGGEGINLAYAIAEKHFLKKGNNRVILATDGDFNVGVSSEDELKKLIEEKRDKGIYLSVLGFGSGNIKDNKMETLADKGNGNYYYLDNFVEARKVLVSQFGGTLYTIAKDVKIQVEFNPALVKEYRLVGYDNRLLNAEDFNNDKKDAGELGSGHTVTALYEIIPAGSSESKTKIDALKYSQVTTNSNTTELATVKFRYKDVKKQDTTSKYIDQVVASKVQDYNLASANFKLAAGVTEFGMLLRESEYKGSSSFKEAGQLVSAAKENDANGYIAGLLELIKIAAELQPTEISKK